MRIVIEFRINRFEFDIIFHDERTTGKAHPPQSSVSLPRNAFTLDLVSKRQNRFIFAIEVFKMANQMGHNE